VSRDGDALRLRERVGLREVRDVRGDVCGFVGSSSMYMGVS
jgi:hypothetical protein